MPKYFFERSETFRRFFQAASRCWPLLKAEIELLPQAKDAVPCVRGWFDAPLPVPLRTVGKLQFDRWRFRGSKRLLCYPEGGLG